MYNNVFVAMGEVNHHPTLTSTNMSTLCSTALEVVYNQETTDLLI